MRRKTISFTDDKVEEGESQLEEHFAIALLLITMKDGDGHRPVPRLCTWGRRVALK